MSLPLPSAARRPPVTTSRRARAIAASLALAAASVLAGCGGDSPGPTESGTGKVTVTAALRGTEIRMLNVSVSGPGIATPIVVSMAVQQDVDAVETTLEIPVGSSRTFTASGFDPDGHVSHQGLATVTVVAGANPTVPLRMHPLLGDVPINIGVGAPTITLSPATIGPLDPGGTQTVTATVTDGGSAVPGAQVRWGSLNPVVASVDNGTVTARQPGTTTIYASYKGAVVALDLVVSGPTAGYRAISPSLEYTCALDWRGAAWCWGTNFVGQLGDGTTESRRAPVAVQGGLRFTSLATSPTHACGVTLDREAWCWGRNSFGELGTGTRGNGSSAPQRVTGGHAWASVYAGEGVTCGVTTAGAGLCWGRGLEGGIGLTGSYNLGNPSVLTSPTPITAAPGPWSSFSIAVLAACGVTTAGEVNCGQTLSNLVTTAGASGITWRSVGVGEIELRDVPPAGLLPHTMAPFACGLTTTGDVRCWGHNLFGELGAGAMSGSATSAQTVSGPQGYSAVAVGGRFACGLQGGAARCWGANHLGQLGDGTTTGRATPGPIAGGHTFTRISAGAGHACGLKADGAAFCWGWNQNGQLGTGNIHNRTMPAAVLPPTARTP